MGKIIQRHICYDGLVIHKYSRNNDYPYKITKVTKDYIYVENDDSWPAASPEIYTSHPVVQIGHRGME